MSSKAITQFTNPGYDIPWGDMECLFAFADSVEY